MDNKKVPKLFFINQKKSQSQLFFQNFEKYLECCRRKVFFTFLQKKFF